ncbi:MAG: polyribonucleotide nucleotidyltransferase [Candidatus Portnoybacteria bacterium RIFCSPLOWO2_12_FULL_39_9]|uniref:Polyribonucleotide nucleotidyltransferase n=1 Tax=Candidatus Portnoybacteria bacterium RIFCSPHIGHO2_12_FULL_38_9 TaxID=1801997 RepID=A0A1G2FEF6_9BACT|nr:MAG: polyribonucleotide nucleotidyltransferase [Candidatus Portnoybacteria bacterium RIFCSPHIGHO2_12_FULL_38_9]OGZ40246.1 MAG: polyribonucleotide nucleotidyltransferase [Candidatus Portnoybacteria bacterium RIFCSPLOWO2_12_FULL_39_9]
MQPKQFKIDFGGRELKIEIGRLAEQANGAVLISYGETVVLATAVMSRFPREVNYLPLLVDYEEKLYAAGKIKGSRFIKREGRATDEALLTDRMIDRCLRPRFDQRIRNDIQIVATVLSFDKENDPDIPSLIASSCALLISDIPWNGPIAGLRVGRIDKNWILNPTYEAREKSDLDLVVAGTAEKINMLEIGGQEVPEKEVLEGIEFGFKHLKKIIDFQKEIAVSLNVSKAVLEIKEPTKELIEKVKDFLSPRLNEIIYQPQKTQREIGLNLLKKETIEALAGQDEETQKQVDGLFEEEIDQLVRRNILKNEKRPDGRRLDEIRPIDCQISYLFRAHGSGLFKRGNTQALSVVTLGAPGDEQTIDNMEIEEKKRFMHHYNFPPFSTGETGPMRGPGRREIGHGALAEKALLPLMPQKEEFPYAVRVVSEILSSNGSSSMASVCGSSLALMDAGVPIKAQAAGIAMGLMLTQPTANLSRDKTGMSRDKADIQQPMDYKILTDIQGPEDHHGDMDCKIAGTKKGVTAGQMDVKIEGINLEILKNVFEQARKARLFILQEMDKAISRPRAELSPFAPRILTIQIDPKKIRNVIGPQGKIINGIISETKVASIDIDDSGLIYITAKDEASGQKALSWIESLTREAKPGEIFQGKVTRILDFGAFVEILPGQEGLVHISELAPHRVEWVEDVVKLGQIIQVKVKNIDELGRINLSLKDAQK